MTSHTHKDEHGKLVKCYHESVQLLTSWQFWIGMTISFPLEHMLWGIWPLNLVFEYFGL